MGVGYEGYAGAFGFWCLALGFGALVFGKC